MTGTDLDDRTAAVPPWLVATAWVVNAASAMGVVAALGWAMVLALGRDLSGGASMVGSGLGLLAVLLLPQIVLGVVLYFTNLGRTFTRGAVAMIVGCAVVGLLNAGCAWLVVTDDSSTAGIFFVFALPVLWGLTVVSLITTWLLGRDGRA